MTPYDCACGHDRLDHIYEQGACRPGFICVEGCEEFTRPKPKRDTPARFLFDRQADSYDADSAMRELAWIDPQIRSFWIEEAGAVLEFISGT